MVHSSNTTSLSSSALGHPAAASTNKGKGKKTVEQCFSAKEKGKGKAKEPKPSTAIDEQIAHLLQQLHEARVLEDVGADILDNPVVQLALSQVLSELDIICNQRDEAQMDLFHSASGKEKHVASPPQLPEAKKAHTKPSLFVKGSSTQRALPVPYDDDVPASDDQRMDEHPDFMVPLPVAGPSNPVTAKDRPPKPAVAKAELSRSTMTKAGKVEANYNSSSSRQLCGHHHNCISCECAAEIRGRND
ncbi:hypothetical protein C0989_006396 [Termitomyces sp. Mn162]|nr:hypothetical protein C0989_006396 [Termitomyces sp. Mn162]